MFFDKKANQGVSEEKKQLRDMLVSCQVYASKIHGKRI